MQDLSEVKLTPQTARVGKRGLGKRLRADGSSVAFAHHHLQESIGELISIRVNRYDDVDATLKNYLRNLRLRAELYTSTMLGIELWLELWRPIGEFRWMYLILNVVHSVGFSNPKTGFFYPLMDRSQYNVYFTGSVVPNDFEPTQYHIRFHELAYTKHKTALLEIMRACYQIFNNPVYVQNFVDRLQELLGLLGYLHKEDGRIYLALNDLSIAMKAKFVYAIFQHVASDDWFIGKSGFFISLNNQMERNYPSEGSMRYIYPKKYSSVPDTIKL